MNNARIITEDESEAKEIISRERETQFTEIIEALQNIGNSSYWKVLEQNIFDVELAKSKRRLEVESETIEIFRLQGEVRLGKRYQLDALLAKYRNELSGIRKQL